MNVEVGAVLGDRYQLRHQIAVGGMGEVWAAHDQFLDRDIAIKVLRAEYAGDEAFLVRLRTEARNSARLSHPNIAQLYDYREEDGRGYLVMELVNGQPLSDLLERTPIMPLDRLLPILAQTARALHAAHVAGVVHRDVKPSNILVSRAGRVKITDFGISTAGGQLTVTAPGMVMGTAQYLSPEQAVGRPATSASDVYALGIIAYEALVGKRPFTGATALDIAVAHVNEAVPPLPETVDARVATLVMRMLDKDPAKRPRTAADVAHQLDSFVAATPPAGIPVVARTTRKVAPAGAPDNAPPTVTPASPASTPVSAAADTSTSAPASAPAASAPASAPAASARPTVPSSISKSNSATNPPTIPPDPNVPPPSAGPVIVGMRPSVAPPTYRPKAPTRRRVGTAQSPSRTSPGTQTVAQSSSSRPSSSRSSSSRSSSSQSGAQLSPIRSRTTRSARRRQQVYARRRTAVLGAAIVLLAIMCVLVGVILAQAFMGAFPAPDQSPAACSGFHHSGPWWTGEFARAVQW